MTCIDGFGVQLPYPSFTGCTDSDVEKELQRELDAITVGELAADEDNITDDEDSGSSKLEEKEEEEMLEEDTLASLQGLLSRWHQQEQKLDTFHKSLDEIDLWTSRGGNLGPTLEEMASEDEASRTKESMSFTGSIATAATSEGQVLLQEMFLSSKSDRSGLSGSHPVDQNKPGEIGHVLANVALSSSLPLVLQEHERPHVGPDMVNVAPGTERAEVMQEYRAAALERSRQREIKQQAQSEDAFRTLAMLEKKKEFLQDEQTNKMAALEKETMLAARLFAEEQLQAEKMFQTEQEEMECKCKALQDIAMTIKLKEQDVERRMLEYKAAQDLKRFNEARRYFAGKKILQAFKKRQSFIQSCCLRIQARARRYLFRKRLKTLENKRDLQTPGSSAVQGAPLTCACHKEVEESGTLNSRPVPASTADSCSQLNKLRYLLKRALIVARNTGTLEQPSNIGLPARSGVLAELDTANGDDFERENDVELHLCSDKDRLVHWLKQFADGWEVARVEANRKICEAKSLGLLTVAMGIQSAMSERENLVVRNLDRCVKQGSRHVIQMWRTKAKMLGLDQALIQSSRLFEERLETSKQELPSLALTGSRQEYMVAICRAESLGIVFEVEQAARTIRKRALQVVKVAQLMASASSPGVTNGLRKWALLENTAALLGMGASVLDYVKRFASETSTSNAVTFCVTLKTDGHGATPRMEIGHNPHAGAGDGDAPTSYHNLEHALNSYGALNNCDFQPWRLGDRNGNMPILSFEQNWKEIDLLRGRWQEHMVASRVCKPAGLGSAAAGADLSDRSVRTDPLETGDAAGIPAVNARHRYCDRMRQSVELNSTGKVDMPCHENSERVTCTKREEGAEEDLVLEVDEESEDDEKRDSEGCKMRQSILMRSDDSFEWERTLCMPLVLTRPMLEQKASCSRFELRRLTKLDMTYDGLSSIGEGNIGQWCPALRVLVLDRNKLTTFRGALKGCEELLEHVSATDNFISSLAGLENLRSLTVLHLEGNSLRQLTAVVPKEPDKPRDQEAKPHADEIPVLASQGYKEVSYETKKSLASRRWARFQDDGCSLPNNCWPKLKELSLSCNKIGRVLRLGSICPNLEVLDLSSNQLVTLGGLQGQGLGGLKSLRVLDVGQNNMKGRSLWESLKNCPLLLSLVASRNRLTELPTHPGSVFLREIWLNGNAIRRLACSAWLPSLQRLYLQDNSIDSLEPVWGCPALEVLDLSFNNISDLCQLRQLACFPCLRTLQLNDNPVSEQADYVVNVLEAVPWLTELDNEAVSETSKDKAVKAIFSNVIDAVGPTYLRENIDKLVLRLSSHPARHQLIRDASNVADQICPDDGLAFVQRAHSSTASQSPSPRQGVMSTSAILRGSADRGTLWANVLEILQSARTSPTLGSRLGIVKTLKDEDLQGHLCSSHLEARWNFLAFQEMGSIHRQRLQTGFRELTSGGAKEGELGFQSMNLNFDKAYHSGMEPDVASVGVQGDTEFGRVSRGKYDPEQSLSDHINFHHTAYKNKLKINSGYSCEMDIYRSRVIKLQALVRRHMARLRFKRLSILRQEEEEARIVELKRKALKQEKDACTVQALWKGLKVRREGILQSLRDEVLERSHQVQSATKIQAAWRGYSMRLRFRQALVRCKYVDNDDYDYISVDENEYAMDDSFLEEVLPTGVDDVTYSGVEFVLGQKVAHSPARDTKLAPEFLGADKGCDGAPSSLAILADKLWNKVGLPVSSCMLPHPSTGRSGGSQRATPRVKTSSITAPMRTSWTEQAQKPIHQVHSKRSKGDESEGSCKAKSGDLWKGKPEEALNEGVGACTTSDVPKRSEGEHQRAELWCDDLPYMRRAMEKKETMVAIVKDWGFKDAKTAEAFLKAREKVKGHARAKGEAYKALLQDPQRRFKIFKARTEVRAPQALDTSAPTTRSSGTSAVKLVVSESELHSLQLSPHGWNSDTRVAVSDSREFLKPGGGGGSGRGRGCGTQTTLSARDRSECSSKSSIRGLQPANDKFMHTSLVTSSSCAALELRPLLSTPDNSIAKQALKRKVKRKSRRAQNPTEARKT